MATPRKFSEKIALHNQKQAEGNAAFEAIMREVTETTKIPTTSCQPGSLPNVNSRANNLSVDLQGALMSLEAIKQQAMGHRFPSEYGHHLPHAGRQVHHTNKRVECQPAAYNSSFLTLPQDSSWRRSSSDSALHATVGGQNVANGPSTADNYPATPINCTPENGLAWNGGNFKKDYDMGNYRPKSCEVPADQNNCAPMYPAPCPVPLPVPNNTGSLPDLSSLQFPAPLVSPMDRDDSQQQQQQQACYGMYAPARQGVNGVAGSHMSSGATLNAPRHVGAMRSTSPVHHRRRHGHAVPSPLVLHSSQSAHVDIAQGLSVDVGGGVMPTYLLHQQQQQHPASVLVDSLSTPCLFPPTSLPYAATSSPSSSPHRARHSLSPQPASRRHLSPHHYHLAASANDNLLSVAQQRGISGRKSPIMSPYRRSPTDSPTSPLSRSYSPAVSPMMPASPLMPPNFPDNYYVQQQFSQTSSLQQQFEHFNMGSAGHQDPASAYSGQHLLSAGGVPPPPGCVDYYQKNHFSRSPLQASSPPQQVSPTQQVPMSSAYAHKMDALLSSEPYVMLSSNQQSGSSRLHIPDIILTGADDTSFGRQDFAKELGHAMAGIPESFEQDDLSCFTDDAMQGMGLDPLDTDSLQLLSDPYGMIADPATEDLFRLDGALQPPVCTAPL